MELGVHSGVQTNNHDRDGWTNGVGGGGLAGKPEHFPEGKGVGHGSAMDGVVGRAQEPQASETEDLSDELQHITTDIIPLSLILTRLAEFSHSALQDKIAELASKPMFRDLANGNHNYSSSGVEDTSPESLEKKTSLLNFVQDLHTRWVKALVITDWSKNAERVGKLIDIRTHLASQVDTFNMAFWELIKTKQEMHWAKVPSPDLKTALAVLSTGEVSWMPEFNYIAPPPLSLEEKASWIHEINMTLNARLQLHEYERIPPPFKNYSIGNGRVTFKVEGEFEVDLTIADEDFESQFWFIDLRFLFSPAPSQFSDNARQFLESKVNEALAADGLAGCYKYLHELILTTKIGEFARQAVELSTARWIHTLKIERLFRALSIQYWLHRPPLAAAKSWIILGVNSDKGSDGEQNPKSPSHLSLRWFRDGKEVKDVVIPFDVDTISTENLLTTVIARHVEHLLSSIYNRLLSKPRFAQGQARLALKISEEEPGDSSLSMQLYGEQDVTVQIERWTGPFTLLPRTAVIAEGQRRFNSSLNPAEDGAALLEQLRCFFTMTDMKTRGKSVGWDVVRSPISAEELKSLVYSGASSREAYQAVWMRYATWKPLWFVMMSMSLSGDQWWLVELSPKPQGINGNRISMFTRMPMSSTDLHMSHSFFSNLAEYAEAIMAEITALRDLRREQLPHAAHQSAEYDPYSHMQVPKIFLRLSDMLPPRDEPNDPAYTPWAKEFIPLVFKGLGSFPLEDQEATTAVIPLQNQETRFGGIIKEATLTVTDRRKFQFLKGALDRDVLYNPDSGQFTFRLRLESSASGISLLKARIQSLQRLIDFVEAIRRAGKGAVPESATLREVVFTYSDKTSNNSTGGTQEPQLWRVRLDLAGEQGVNVILDKGNPHLRVIDYLRDAANSPKFDALPAWFILTLPLYRALERLEDAWENILANGGGSCYVFQKALDWVTIRFALPGSNLRKANLDIKSRGKNGKLIWYISRAATDPLANNENDEFNKVLKQRVWPISGNGFHGLTTGSSASSDHGIENLLALISESMLSMVGTPPPPHLQLQQAQQPQPQAQPQAQAPHLPQDQQQQPVPPQGGPLAQQGLPARFPQQHHQQRPQQPHMPQPNMHNQGQHPGQGQGQRSGMGKNNTPVVVLD